MFIELYAQLEQPNSSGDIVKLLNVEAVASPYNRLSYV